MPTRKSIYLVLTQTELLKTMLSPKFPKLHQLIQSLKGFGDIHKVL